MSKRSVSKKIAYIFLGIVLVLFLLVGAALSPIGVNIIVGIANDQEGIDVQDVSGSFYTQLDIGSVDIDLASIQVDGENLIVDLGLNCLFSGVACVDKLHAGSLSVVLLGGQQEEVDEVPPSNEYVRMPLPIKISSVSFANFILFQQVAGQPEKFVEINDLKLVANADKQIVIETLTVNSVDVYLGLQEPSAGKEPLADKEPSSGEKPSADKEPSADEEPSADPNTSLLQMIADYEYQAIEIPEIFVPIELIVRKFNVNKLCLHQADILCTQTSSIKASLLKQKVTLNLLTNPTEQVLKSIAADVELALNDKYRHKIKIDLTPNLSLTSNVAEKLALNVSGDVSKLALSLKHQVSKSTGSLGLPVLLNLDVETDIGSPTLPLKLQVTAKNYLSSLKAWLPKINMPVETLDMSVSGDSQLYSIELNAQTVSQFFEPSFEILSDESTQDTEEPARDTEEGLQQAKALNPIEAIQSSKIGLIAKASLFNKSLSIDRLSTSGPIGDLLATSHTNLVSASANQQVLKSVTQIEFTQLKIQELVPDITSELSGKVAFEGSLDDNHIWGAISCEDIQGTIQGQNLTLNCDTTLSKSGVLQVKKLTLQQAGNDLRAKGELVLPLDTTSKGQAKSNFNLSLMLDDLPSIHPDLSGIVEGEISVQGMVNAPNIIAKLNINGLQFQDTGIESATLNAEVDLANNWKTDIALISNNINVAGQSIELANLSVNGDINAHSIAISATHPEVQFTHTLEGKLSMPSENNQNQKPSWQGNWLSGEWNLPFDTVKLDQTIPIFASASQVDVGDHCWIANSSANEQSLCIQDLAYQSIPDTDQKDTQAKLTLNYDLGKPLRHYVQDLFKPGTTVPMLSKIAIDMSSDGGLQAYAYNLIANAKLVSVERNIDLLAVVANIELDNDVLSNVVFAGTKATGALGLRSQLTLAPENRTHSGQLKIEDLDLSPLKQYLATVEKLVGKINGDLIFEGPLDKPLVNGALYVNNGELVLDNYPYPFTEFNQSIEVVNNKATIEGEFELGSGSADYDGELDFNQAFLFTGNIRGAGMQLAYEEHDLLATPNLSLSISPTQFTLKGEIAIPNAEIKIKELPKSAKSPSSDVLIIGKPPEPAAVPMGLDVDLRLLIDKPKLKRVKIDALDLRASLAGDLHLRVIQKYDEEQQQASAMETYLNGTVNVLDGKYEAYGQMLQIREGSIFFSGLPSLPQFNLSAIRNPLNTADNVIAGVRITGNPVLPKVDLFSEPNMSQARQLSYLLQGTDFGGGEGTSNDVMLANMLVNFGIGSSENSVNKLGKSLGFQSLGFQTAGQGTNTQVQLTGRLSDNIQITYGVGLFDSASEVILKYQLMPKMYIEAKGGAESAIDLFYEITRGE